MKMLMFWSRAAWIEHPISCGLVLVLLLSFVMVGGRLGGEPAARSEMVTLAPEEQILDAAVGAADGDRAKAEAAAKRDWPDECGSEIEGEACATALYETTHFPSTAKAMIVAVTGLGLGRDAFRSAAIAYADLPSSAGWGAFPGGATIEPLGPKREEIAEYASLAPNSQSTSLNLSDLQRVVQNVLANDRVQQKTAKASAEATLNHGYSLFTHTLRQGATTALFFMALTVLWRLWQSLIGWRRTLTAIALIVTLIAFVSPGALSGLGLDAAKVTVGHGEGLESVVAAPFAAIGQVLDAIRETALALGEAATQHRILVSAMFLVVMLAERPAFVLLAGYGIILAPRWLETASFTLVPVDLSAFDVAAAAPVLAFAVGIIGAVFAVLLVRGTYAAFGPAVVQAATRIVAPAEA